MAQSSEEGTARSNALDASIQHTLTMSNVPSCIVLGPEHRCAFVSPHFHGTLSVETDVIGKSFAEITGTAFAHTVRASLDTVYLDGRTERLNAVAIEFPEQSRRYLDIRFSPLRDEQAQVIGVVIEADDVTEHVTAREPHTNNLAIQALRQYQTMLEHFPNGAVFMFDHELRYTVARGAGLARASLTSETFEGKTIWEIWPAEIAQRDAPVLQAALEGVASVVEVPYEGETVEVHTLPIRDEHGTVIGGMVVTQEITERKRAEEALRQQALYDPLTRLPNRTLLWDRLERAKARAQRSPHTWVALLFLDLDHFKTINDSLGHATGDAILVEAARRMETCVRPSDTVARLGGDEFIVLLEDLENLNAATEVAERLIMVFNSTVTVDQRDVQIRVSIGIAGSNENIDPATLLHQGDTAMYAAKKEGRARYVVYDAVQHAAIFTAERWARAQSHGI